MHIDIHIYTYMHTYGDIHNYKHILYLEMSASHIVEWSFICDTEGESVRAYTYGIGVRVDWIWFVRVCATVHCTHIFLKTQTKQQST